MNEIISYLVEEKKQTEFVAKMLAKKLAKYPDIEEAFIKWLNTREYSDEPMVEGYTAKMIHELQPQMDASGVYQFLITLRDDPVKAKEIIKSNFARK